MSIRWPNVLVIFRREVRDQLRDKRTLFMIFVLPMLLYPILGMGIAQVEANRDTKVRTVYVIGPENLPTSPPLLNAEANGFHPDLFDSDAEATRLTVLTKKAEGVWLDAKLREATTRQGRVDAIVLIPANLPAQIEAKESPAVSVDYDSADDRSQVTYLRVKEVLSRWRKLLLERRLAGDNLPRAYTEPITIKPMDVATPAELGSSVWSRLFPFLLVMMSLTGAFYPAVDLCAGEKERGTMETLLISPASRAEIVLGKFLTVFIASVSTALLNLASMALTGLGVARLIGSSAGPAGVPRRAMAALSLPSPMTAVWIVLLLIPLAVFFSALCLALAVLARSMKEGQYYMTPLYLICLPLMFLSLGPEIELNLFYSFVPITGVALLLKSLIQADYQVATRYFLPVLLPTVVYGALALRWAVDQFQREDVLFREAERFDLRLWVRHLFRDKEPTPNGAEALFCFALMLSLAWFLTPNLGLVGLGSTTSGMAAGQLAFVLTPPLAMGLFLTSSPRRTLRLYWPAPRHLALAVGLALAVNPLVNELRPMVELLFPMSENLKQALQQMMAGVTDLPTALLLLAVIPAICEEVAFRGYMLSGLERTYSDRTAVLLSALLFGIMHVLMSLFQQFFNAALLGLVLGLLAVRSRSLLPGVVFHLINNGLAVGSSAWVASASGKRLGPWLYRDATQGLYHGSVVAASVAVTGVLLVLLVRDRGAAGPRSSPVDEPAAGPLVHAG